MGGQSVGVAVIPCALVFWGVCWPAGHRFAVMDNSLVTAGMPVTTCVPCCVPCGNTCLSKHRNPVFPDFPPPRLFLTRTWPVLGKGGGFRKVLQIDLWPLNVLGRRKV